AIAFLTIGPRGKTNPADPIADHYDHEESAAGGAPTPARRSAAGDDPVVPLRGDELPLGHVDLEPVPRELEELVGGVSGLHQTVAAVDLRRHQVVAELMRERAAHRPRQLDFLFGGGPPADPRRPPCPLRP